MKEISMPGYDSNHPIFAELNPGIERTGYVIFDVPKGTQLTKLSFSGNWLSSKRPVVYDISGK